MGPAHAASNGSGEHASERAVPAARHRGLVSLLAHDLRVPLGPLALATSSLASDPGIGGSAREYAQIAYAQSTRVGRMMSAALAASGRLPTMRRSRLSMTQMLRATGDAFCRLGGVMTVHGNEWGSGGHVTADQTVLGECLLNVAELAGGPAMRTAATIERAARVIVGFSCDDAGRCADAFAKDVPDDADSAFALAAVAVVGALGGLVEVTDDEIVLAFRSAEEE